MAQLEKYFPGKHNGLSSIPQIHINKPGTALHAGNISNGEAETGGSQGFTGQQAEPN